MKKQLHYILIGYPFAGKTYLAKEIAKKFDYIRLSIDEVKFELGYKRVSDDDVPDEVWERIFKELDKRITSSLKSGKTIINEYAWLTKDWRDRARNLATELGIETKLIFVDTPVEVVRQRWRANRKTSERFDVPDSVFEDSIRLFERPTKEECVIVFTQNDNLNDWISKNLR